MSDESNERKEESANNGTSADAVKPEAAAAPESPAASAPEAAAADTPAAAPAAADAGGGDEDADKAAKAQAAAEARAARAAAREARAAAGGGAAAPAPAEGAAPAAAAGGGDADADKEAARAAARAARAAARAGKTEGAADGAPAEPKAPSPKQPVLDRAVQLIREHVSAEAVVEAFINERDRDLPVLSIRAEDWLQTARFLKDHDELSLNYLRNLSGVDYETYMEVVVYLISLDNKQDYCVKIKTDRDAPSVPSVTPVWETANWQEREVYDLLGIDFPGHPDMSRIMLPDDWIGHPLRKDYQPIDPEV